jgi:8-oxo-dGTP pyrophosphatase MutT (NUDIX family)
MYLHRYIEKLRIELAEGQLPGLSAQRRLAPRGRIPDDYHPEPPRSRQAAVLIHLIPGPEGERQNRPCFPVILRPPHDLYHAGQIALPGGEREEEDDFPAGTALREASEEIGLAPEEAQVAGTLTPLFISVSNFSVVPVVSWGHERPRLRPDPREVAEAFFVCTDELLNPPATGEFPVRDGFRRAPYFPCGQGRIWGATAMILSEFADIHRRITETLA